MTNEVTAYATSPRVGATRRMDFPYHDVTGVMGFGCDSDSEWAYFRFTQPPNLINDDPEDGYSTFQARLRWDEQLATMPMTQEWGSESINFRRDADAISRIQASNSVRLELKWHGNDNVYFDFPLKGSSAAIAQARSTCGTQ